MSKLRRIKTKFTSEHAPASAIEKVCAVRKAQYQVGQGDALHLYGYKGDQRAETATYAIRRQYIDREAVRTLHPDRHRSHIVKGHGAPPGWRRWERRLATSEV